MDEDGNYDYSGNCSGLLLVERIRERCDSLLDRRVQQAQKPPGPGHLQRSHSGTPSSRSLSHSRTRQRTLTILPPWDMATRYVSIAFSDAFSLFNFMHRPTFETRLNDFYSARTAGLELTTEDIRFEGLLNAIFALGELFGGLDETRRDDGARTIRGEEFFAIAQQCIDIPEGRDPLSLQALLCLIIYLQGSGQLPKCYTYVSMAMTAAIRMGLHRADSLHKFNTIERETRRRIFWTLRVMDSYITTVLDLPRTLVDEEMDQTYPKDVDDIYVTLQGVKRTNEPCVMASINAHTKLTRILAKVKQIASGSSDQDHKPNARYQVDYVKIVQAEKELQEWTAQLPTYSKFPDHMRRDMERAQLLLRVAHAHVQMVLYRPFLHHIGRRNTDGNFDFRAFACASACVKAAMQAIWLAQALDDAHLLNGPVWLLFFTLFMAVVSSIMFVITNKDDPSAGEYYAAAQRGFTILEKFAPTNPMARNYTESLRPLFCHTSKECDNEDADMTPVPSTTMANTFRPMNAMLKAPSLTFAQSPTTNMFRSHPHPPNDVYLGAQAEPMNFMMDSRPVSISMPGPTLPSMDDPSASQVYLQAMNCTPTNFFEGFSSETAMMDYFSWQQDAGPSTNNFSFQ